MSSTCSSSRRGEPVPQLVTSRLPGATASSYRRMSAGSRCEPCGEKLSPGPYRLVGIAEIQVSPYWRRTAWTLQDPRDLGDGVGVVGRLEVASQQGVLVDGLRRQLRIDARGSEEEEPLDAVLEGGVHHVDLDLQVLGQEVDGVGVVRHDAADLGRREHDVTRLGLGEVVEDGASVTQVQLGGGPPDEVCEALGLQLPPDGRPHQAAMAGDVDRRVPVQGRRMLALMLAEDGASANRRDRAGRSTACPRGLSASMSASTMMRASCSVST